MARAGIRLLFMVTPSAYFALCRRTAEKLRTIHSALDDALGDTDVTHIEDDDELRAEHPVQWAAEKLAEVINSLET